jgi:cyclopropane fatty-acyl-phospholipid synthase-like methyltransferase
VNDLTRLEDSVINSKQLDAGSTDHYRAYVGPPSQFDFMGATQFRLATSLGLREEHCFLDVGCGSLRAGKLMIQYLLPNRYFGLEPNSWLYEQAIANELGQEIISIKRPRFLNNRDFNVSEFNQQFSFIFAQSIFSHTSLGLFRSAIQKLKTFLNASGQFMFTVLSEGTPNFSSLPRAEKANGWIYPGCVAIREEQVIAACKQNGLFVQKLSWFHPRQIWYRAVLSENLLIKDLDQKIGAGLVLMDDRFAEAVNNIWERIKNSKST